MDQMMIRLLYINLLFSRINNNKKPGGKEAEEAEINKINILKNYIVKFTM